MPRAHCVAVLQKLQRVVALAVREGVIEHGLGGTFLSIFLLMNQSAVRTPKAAHSDEIVHLIRRKPGQPFRGKLSLSLRAGFIYPSFRSLPAMRQTQKGARQNERCFAHTAPFYSTLIWHETDCRAPNKMARNRIIAPNKVARFRCGVFWWCDPFKGH